MNYRYNNLAGMWNLDREKNNFPYTRTTKITNYCKGFSSAVEEIKDLLYHTCKNHQWVIERKKNIWKPVKPKVPTFHMTESEEFSFNYIVPQNKNVLYSVYTATNNRMLTNSQKRTRPFYYILYFINFI